MPSANATHIAPRRFLAALVVLVSLVAAACTASTTIESVDSATTPTLNASEQPTPAESNVAPPTPQATPEAETTEPDDPEPVPTEVTPAEEEPATEALPSGTTEVVLLDPGAEPRTELRLMIAASCGETMTVDQTQELTQSVDGLDLPSAGAVGTVVEMSNSATRVGDNYETRSEITASYASPGAEPSVAASLNAELERLVGITAFVTITDRGVQLPDTYRVEGAEVLGPLQAAVETISQVQAPLPIEAVGVGARWQTTSVVDFEGAALMTVTEYQITGREGTLVDLDVSGTQTVEVGSTMTMQGFAVEITEWIGTTTGQTTLDLATISPIRSVATTQATQGLDLGAEGLLLQEIESVITLTSEPDAGCTGRTTRP